MKSQLIALLGGVSLANPALAAPPVVPEDISIFAENGALVARTSQDSMPIYTYDRDRPGKSSCTGACANRWRAILATARSKPVGDWTIIPGANGKRQWAYKNRPLYTYTSDTPGHATGDGVGGVWHLLPAIPEDLPS